jgi:hypothetical protein
MRSLESITGNSETYLKIVTDPEISFDNIYCVQIRDAIVTGADIIFLDHRPVFFDEVHPFYSYKLYPPPTIRRGDLNNSTKINISSPLVLITDWKSNTYGHFLLEMLPKIIGFIKLKEKYPNARLLVSSLAGKSAISIIQHFIRKHEMLIYDGQTQSISCSCLIVISKLLGGKGFHPAMHSFVSLAKTCVNSLLQSSNIPRKLYLSKARWRQSSLGVDYRRPTNETELQSYLGAADKPKSTALQLIPAEISC